MRALVLCACACLGLWACAAAPPPDPKNPGKPEAASPTSEEATTKTAPATSGAGESSDFHADVVEVRDSGESAPYKSVKMRFANPSGKACEVTQYELTWPGGRKLVNGDRSSSFEKFIVPAGATRQRSLRVHPSDGETLSLDVAGAKLHADCN